MFPRREAQASLMLWVIGAHSWDTLIPTPPLHGCSAGKVFASRPDGRVSHAFRAPWNWVVRVRLPLSLGPEKVLLPFSKQVPRLGGAGMAGAGLSQVLLEQLQRFDPSAAPLQDSDSQFLQEASSDQLIQLANMDCIGFFIAKFLKCQSTKEP